MPAFTFGSQPYSSVDTARLDVGCAATCCAFVYTLMYNFQMKIAGFDWDAGNWPKCGKHGVSRAEIEDMLLGTPAVMADPHSAESRMRAIGKTRIGRYVFLVFVLKKVDGQILLRPISARYMHKKEVEHFAKQN
ncbi:MAG TPA: BrnT family toxin [Eoetvoesiella sp.]|nr:BrnT family toxin [Pollutimonas subterranea]